VTNWNKLLAVLDSTLGFPNKVRSTVRKKAQVFDQRTGEHVFVLEYRIKVNPGTQPSAKQQSRLNATPDTDGPMGMIRQLVALT
jgi:hypothetical protein